LDCSQGFATIALCEGERVIVQYCFFFAGCHVPCEGMVAMMEARQDSRWIRMWM
jgi:hypothetical protein